MVEKSFFQFRISSEMKKNDNNAFYFTHSLVQKTNQVKQTKINRQLI